MGLREYREYEQVKPQRKEPNKKSEQKRKQLYIENKAKKRVLSEKKVKNSVLIVSALIFICGFLTVSRDIKIYKMKEDITKSQNETKLLKEENEDLKIKLLKNSSLEKIEKIAKEKLKMISPNNEDIMDFNNLIKDENGAILQGN